MAKKPGLDVKGAQGGLSELKSRLLFVLGAIIVFRAGSYVPIPGIEAAVLAELFQQHPGSLLNQYQLAILLLYHYQQLLSRFCWFYSGIQ